MGASYLAPAIAGLVTLVASFYFARVNAQDDRTAALAEVELYAKLDPAAPEAQALRSAIGRRLGRWAAAPQTLRWGTFLLLCGLVGLAYVALALAVVVGYRQSVLDLELARALARQDQARAADVRLQLDFLKQWGRQLLELSLGFAGVGALGGLAGFLMSWLRSRRLQAELAPYRARSQPGEEIPLLRDIGVARRADGGAGGAADCDGLADEAVEGVGGVGPPDGAVGQVPARRRRRPSSDE